MFAEYLENALTSDPTAQLIPCSPPPVLDDGVIIPPIANLCVPTFGPNTDFTFDLYLRREQHFDSTTHQCYFAFPTVDFKSSALMSLVEILMLFLTLDVPTTSFGIVLSFITMLRKLSLLAQQIVGL